MLGDPVSDRLGGQYVYSLGNFIHYIQKESVFLEHSGTGSACLIRSFEVHNLRLGVNSDCEDMLQSNR